MLRRSLTITFIIFSIYGTLRTTGGRSLTITFIIFSIYGTLHRTGLTQVELADKIGVSKSQYIRYETKDVQPPANIMNKLADALATSVDYLISGDKSEKAKASLKNS